MENLEQRLKELHKDIILDICMNVNNCAIAIMTKHDK